MPQVVHGRLLEPTDAPRAGELVDEVARVGNLLIEQILSGETAPMDYLQTHDEWVVVLAGAATLEVEGGAIELRPGDWVLLPSGRPHRLLRTQPGTSWLAVHSLPT